TGCRSARDYAGRFPVATTCNATPSDVGSRGSVTGYGQVGFDEATSEQYLWLAPQNIAGLATVLGGRDALADRLDTFMTGGYNVGANVPRMWLGNEPNFATPWIYNYLGRPWRTQEVVEEMRTQLWGTGRDGAEPGNDDLGAMSSWYVWAALGIYPATPGTDVLTVNSPTFEKAEIALGNGHTLTINAPGATGKRYLGGLSVNGTAQTGTALPDGGREADTTLDFTMSATATDWGNGRNDAPPSWADGSNPTIAYADPVTVAPGASGTLDLAIQRVTATGSTYSLDLTDAPAGFAVTSTKTTDFDSRGHAVQPLRVSVAAGVAEGDYSFPVTVVTGAKRQATEVTVRVARDGGFLAQTTLQSISATAANAGGFDSSSSLERDLLEAAGLVAGDAVELGALTGSTALAGLTVRLPAVSEGLADSIVPNGQTVVLQGAPTRISFVGAAANGNTAGTASVTLDDGTVVTGVDLSLGDWVLPSTTGSKLDGSLAPYGTNLKVVWTGHRNGQGSSTNPGAYVYATAPYTAPAGRTIASVKLTGSSSDKRRVLAIAQDTPDGAATLPTQAISATSVAAGGSLTVTGANLADGEAVSVTLGDRTVGTGTATAGGTVAVTVAIPRLQAAGTYQVQLVGATSGAAKADQLTVTAATWSPVLTVAATTVVGSQLTFTATGFGESEAVTAGFGDAGAALYASASGKVTGSIAAPAEPGQVTLTLTGAESGATVAKVVTVTPLVSGPEVKVTLSAAPALITYGGSVVLTAQVPDGTTGAIQFLEGTRVLGEAAISGSQAAVTVKGLPAGSHPVRAVETSSKATSATVHVVVTKATIKAIKVARSSYRRGKTAKVTVTLGALPSGQLAAGTVTLKAGSKTIGKVAVNGKAKVTVTVSKKYTKAKKLVVRAVFTPADSKNLLSRTSAAVTLTGKKK
ncbi:MAG: glycoside hydrolase family 92 protein, partial [Propionicimonas sp.]|nr:glycoside hydrolase family 92 protein [Propionicimonas sp.]